MEIIHFSQNIESLKKKIKYDLNKASKEFSQFPDKDSIREAFLPKKINRLFKLKNFINEKEEEVISNFVDGEKIDFIHISPKLELVENNYQKTLFKYCRLLSSYPYTQNVGRKLEFIVRDSNLENNPIMGILSLGSAVRNLKVRDDWIGWGGNENLQIKKRFLSNC